MNPALKKRRPLRLEMADYQALREEVLRRDRWTCQLCGSRQNLEVHHLEPRGRSGPDTMENLLTLCAACHRRQHEATR